MFDKFFVGSDLTSAKDSGKQRPISRVTLLLDDSSAVTAGDDTGTELVADCPHATQEMVNAILARVKGHQYQMYSAENANLDPSAELGDGVTVDGIYSVISRIDDDGSGYAGLSAPGEAELEDEFPAGGPMTREFSRKIAETRSRITKTAEEIRLEVFNEVEGLSASIDIRLDGITQKVTGLAGAYSTLSQKVDGFSLEVVNGSESSLIMLKSNGVAISSQSIEITGAVTFSDLNAPGKTTIYGGNIDTSTLRVNSLYGQYIKLNNDQGDAMGMLSITGSSSAPMFGAVDLTSYGALRLTAQWGAAYLESSQYNTSIEINNAIATRGDLISYNVSGLGASYYPWRDVYANNAEIQTSDLTVKKDVEYGLSRYDALFDALRPMSFLFQNGESGRRHMGLGAQDVEEAMAACGVSDMEFAAFIKSPRPDGEGYDYALRYGELIPMCIGQIQGLKSLFRGLKDRIDELERRIAQ